MLVLLDQPVEQIGIAAAKPTRNLAIFLGHRMHEVTSRCVHTENTQRPVKKTQGYEGEEKTSRNLLITDVIFLKRRRCFPLPFAG